MSKSLTDPTQQSPDETAFWDRAERELRDIPAPRFTPGRPDTRLHLTCREFQTWELIALAFPNKLIADNLGISIKSVEKYRNSLNKKLGSRCTAEVVRAAIAFGVVRVQPDFRGYVVNGRPRAAPHSVAAGMEAAR